MSYESVSSTVVTETIEAKVRVSTGQNGPPLDLTRQMLNDKEEAVVRALLGESVAQPITVLAAQAFPEQAKGNSWVRNALRRLVRGGWVERVGRGTYRATSRAGELWSMPASDSSEL